MAQNLIVCMFFKPNLQDLLKVEDRTKKNKEKEIRAGLSKASPIIFSFWV